jgi:hypothetical protein
MNSLWSWKGPGSSQAYTKAKRIVRPIYTFIEGREGNFLLIPMKREEKGVPHLLKQQHNQRGGSNRTLANKYSSLFIYFMTAVVILLECGLRGAEMVWMVRPDLTCLPHQRIEKRKFIKPKLGKKIYC